MQMGETFRARFEDGHRAEHEACEHLDGAVPFVVCRICGEAWGYHVGHEGAWQDCTQGWCAPLDDGTRWDWNTGEPVPDDVTGACSLCGEYLYGDDDTFGPYLSAGDGVYCSTCAASATRGVI